MHTLKILCPLWRWWQDWTTEGDPWQEQGSMCEASSGFLPVDVASWVLPYCISLRSISTLSSHLRLGLQSGFALSGYFTRTLCVSLRPLSASCSVHFIVRDLMTLIRLYLAWNTHPELLCASSESSCSFLLGPRIFLCLLFSITLTPCSSCNVRDGVSHPYSTTRNFF